MTISLQASPAFRRGVLIAAFVLAAAEIAVFVMLWRVGRLVDPGADPHAGLLFIGLGSALTLQAMAVVGVAWVMVAMSWTVLNEDITGVSLEHPWRRWHVRAALPARTWLEGSAKQLHLARTTLPICLTAIGVGGLILGWVLQAIR